MKAVAVFQSSDVQGSILFVQTLKNTTVYIHFAKLPDGYHGLHIHKGGDLRQGCASLCEHFHVGTPTSHGGPPGTTEHRHTGDLGNVHMTEINDKVYILENISVEDLYGRSVILHEDTDDYGMGP